VFEDRTAARGFSFGRAWPWALAAVAVGVLATNIVHAWPFTVDDTYITLRYSRNVADGLGPTFNAIGPRAEGYTSFSWMIALAVPHALGLDAVLFAKGVAIVATFSTLVVAMRWARAETREGSPDATDAPAWAASAAALCLASIPATAVHAVSGMETAPFTLFLTALFAASSGAVRGRRHAAVRMGILALLLGLTRPEGNLAALVAIVAVVVQLPRSRRAAFAARSVLVWAVPIAGYEIWRRAYYGLPFPLPFYVKLATPGLLPGWPDVRDWLCGPALHFGVLLLPVLARPSRAIRPALAATAVLTGFFVFPQHQMGYDHRYLAPLDPSLAALAGMGLARLVSWMHRVRPAGATVAAAAAVVVTSGLESMGSRAVIAGEAEYGEGLAQAHARLGRELFALDLPAGRLVISDAGAVPYYSRWWTLDLVGLNDAAIATTGRRDPASVLAQRPDVVVLASPRTDRVEPWDWNTWEPALYDACIEAGFVRVGLRRFASDYWLWVLARPDSEAARTLAPL
jgi:arabinofuranosyltransferase